jgi:hypothetical protein
MSVNKFFTAVLLLLSISAALAAQNTNSPYSRNGFGTLETPALGKSRSMGGIGIGLREKNMINFLNPASISSLDTLTMLMDFGVSGQYSRFGENDNIQMNPNGGLDYVAIKVPLKRYWGLAFGLVPYSKVGYSYSMDGSLYDYLGNEIEYTKSYAGTGGMNTLYIGTSVSLWKKLALGVNYKYSFGTITQSSALVSTNSEFNSKSPTEYWYMNNSSFDLGIQYDQKFGKKSRLVLGAVFSEKSHVNNEIYKLDITTDTIASSGESKFEFPSSLGLGLSWTYDDRLTIGLDYQKQLWSNALFYGSKDTLSDNTRIALGVEYLPSVFAMHYFQAIKYRFGLYYTDSYMNYPSGNLKNVGLTLGVGLPLRGQKSALNLSFDAGKILTPSASFISENYFKLSVGVTFNELWFFKRKL